MSFLLAPTVRMVPPGEIVTTWSTSHIIFMLFAVLTIFGAISTIVQKNDVAAVMSLVATFFGLAAIYTFLSAHFIAALQVLVYAGAIMVLFIFVVMVLNRDETDPWVWRGLLSKITFGAVPMIWLLAMFVGWPKFWFLDGHVGFLKTALVVRPEAPGEDFGTIAQVGELLFTDYLFAFEAISVLLLIAVIAAVVVARTSKHVDHSAADHAPSHTAGH